MNKPQRKRRSTRGKRADWSRCVKHVGRTGRVGWLSGWGTASAALPVWALGPASGHAASARRSFIGENFLDRLARVFIHFFFEGSGFIHLYSEEIRFPISCEQCCRERAE
jgi:hypothetical protein